MISRVNGHQTLSGKGLAHALELEGRIIGVPSIGRYSTDPTYHCVSFLVTEPPNLGSLNVPPVTRRLKFRFDYFRTILGVYMAPRSDLKRSQFWIPGMWREVIALSSPDPVESPRIYRHELCGDAVLSVPLRLSVGTLYFIVDGDLYGNVGVTTFAHDNDNINELYCGRDAGVSLIWENVREAWPKGRSFFSEENKRG